LDSQLDELNATIKKQRAALNKKREEADKLSYTAEQEEDEGKQEGLFNAARVAHEAAETMEQEIEDNVFTAGQYQFARRDTVQNARIQNATLFAEKANAEMMTAYKDQANLKEDIKDNEAKIGKLEKKRDAESYAAKKKALQYQINDLDVTGMKAQLGFMPDIIKKMTKKVEKADATAIEMKTIIAIENANYDVKIASDRVEHMQ